MTKYFIMKIIFKWLNLDLNVDKNKIQFIFTNGEINIKMLIYNLFMC